MIQEYIQQQLAVDKLVNQMSKKELVDPFTGGKVVKGTLEPAIKDSIFGRPSERE